MPSNDQAERRAFASLSDFTGMVTAADPHNLPPGAAQIQINLQSNVPGELAVRGGLRRVTFESEE